MMSYLQRFWRLQSATTTDNGGSLFSKTFEPRCSSVPANTGIKSYFICKILANTVVKKQSFMATDSVHV